MALLDMDDKSGPPGEILWVSVQFRGSEVRELGLVKILHIHGHCTITQSTHPAARPHLLLSGHNVHVQQQQLAIFPL